MLEAVVERVPGRVSVIIPCYNLADYLGIAVDSIDAQTHRDVELVLGDDGSTDGTRDLLAAYEARPNVKVIYSPGNIGPFALRNLCMARASGEYIAFLDGDDFWAPDKLEKQLAAFAAAPDAGLCHTYSMRVDANGTPERRLDLSAEPYVGDCFHAMLRNNGVSTSSVVLRHSLLDRIGPFDERFRYRGDWEMWARAAQAAPFAFVPEDLTFYRIHGENISGKTDKIRPYAFAIVDKFATEYGLTPAEVRAYVDPARADLLAGFGMTNLVRRDLRGARADLLAALGHRPFNPRLWLGLLKTFVYRPAA